MYLRYSIPGVNPMHPNNSRHAIWAFQHVFLATISSSRPVGGTRRIQNIAYDSDIILENLRLQMIACDRIEFPASWNQHNGILNDANQHALNFFPVPCSDLDLSRLCFSSTSALLLALLAGRGMAEMSFNQSHEFDAPWFSGQAGHYSWEERLWFLKNRAAPQCVRRERQREKVSHVCRCGAPWFS
jgi:hypothetical protein